MYRLTERRRAKAEPILRGYKEQLNAGGTMQVHAFEAELRKCWGVGYQELKDIIEDLSKVHGYAYVAAYYMENSNSGVGVVTEFQPVLAALYGIDDYDGGDREEARRAFWGKHKRSSG